MVSTGELEQGRDHSRAVLCALGWARGRGIPDTWDRQNLVIHCMGVEAEVGLGSTPEGGSMWPQSTSSQVLAGASGRRELPGEDGRGSCLPWTEGGRRGLE